MLKVENISKSFGKLKVLKNINLEVNKGDRIVIIGPSGSGKSTFLRCLNYLAKPDSGKIYLDNHEINDNNIILYRQKIGMVFQNFNLFNNLTVMDNITLAPIKLGIYNEKEAKKKAMEYLRRIDLAEKALVYPSNLSGGQKQRVAIVRTLMMKPEMILFDEPTSALDPEMVKEVQDLMIELADEGMTMIVVTHEVSFVKKVATKIVFMNDGKIILTGTYDEMMKSDNETVKIFLSNIK